MVTLTCCRFVKTHPLPVEFKAELTDEASLPELVGGIPLPLCFQGGGEQGLQEAGRPASPGQMRGARQRGRFQGGGERPYLTAEEH